MNFESAGILFIAALLISLPFSAGAQSHATELRQAAELMQESKFGAAVNILDGVVQADTSDLEAWNLLGIASAQSGQSAKAEAAFRAGLRVNPTGVSLLENLGFLYYQQARYADAAEFLSKAVDQGSHTPGVRFSLAASRLRIGESGPARQDLIALEPDLRDRHEYWEERGRADLLAQPRDAESEFVRALELDGRSLVALNGAAQAAAAQNLDEKALSYLLKARQLAPEDSATALHFAEVCIRRDLGLDARQALEPLHRREPANTLATFLLARADIALQNWQSAAALFTEYIRRVPGYAPAHFALGWVDEKLNRRAAAREELQLAVRLNPKLTDARCELAQFLLNNGEQAQAKEQFERVLTTDGAHAKANEALGNLSLRAGDFERARTYLEKAVSTDPKSAAAHYKLATVLERIHNTERAAEERSIAARLTAESGREAHMQLRLATPDGRGER